MIKMTPSQLTFLVVGLLAYAAIMTATVLYQNRFDTVELYLKGPAVSVVGHVLYVHGKAVARRAEIGTWVPLDGVTTITGDFITVRVPR